MDHQEMMESDQQSLEGMLMSPAKPQQESPVKKPRPQPEQAPECPRCESTNTKFCYYNNYSLSQPRYFCKSCRRYWTKGGTLRNVPVGGGCRKSKRASSSSKRISIAATTQHRDHQHSDHQHSDSNVPLTALDNLAYEAWNLGESFHLPLIFAHQLHHKFPDRQIDGYDFPMGEGFIGAPSMDNLQGLCFGLGDGAMGEADTDRGIGGESMLPYKEMKLDHFCSGENAVLLGCPWPLMGGDGISNPGNLGSIGGSWDDTGFSSSLHSLVNSPLM